jgi:hypothetical protein
LVEVPVLIGLLHVSLHCYRRLYLATEREQGVESAATPSSEASWHQRPSAEIAANSKKLLALINAEVAGTQCCLLSWRL